MAHVAGSFLLQLALQVEHLLPQDNATVLCSPGDEARAEYWAFGHGHWTMKEGCAVAHRKKDFAYWSSTWAAGLTALKGSPSYKDPAIHTADGVYIFDAEFCTVNGFLDLPNKAQLLQNYSAIMEMEERACNSEPLQSLSASAHTSALREAVAMFNAEGEKDAAIRGAPFLETGVLERVNAEHCTKRRYSCMIHFCLNNFCKLSDGRVGQGCQCRKDFRLMPVPTSGRV
ncbi:NHX7 [Symbiodinium natans]|uniref:NHX7 protein n=1 Tax=Symbiodinium natans TaxID=878477 RepID=A0A812MZS9_9DINO|nr:NHX7 [Symbiodinium natans]